MLAPPEWIRLPLGLSGTAFTTVRIRMFAVRHHVGMPNPPRFNWLEVLDLPGALRTCTTEMYGDWVRDPWSWPELRFLAHNPEHLDDRLTSRRVRFEQVSVPKTNFGTRPAVVQDPIDRLILHCLVNRVSRSVIGGMEPFVMGWRLDREDPKSGRAVSNQQEWLRFIADRRTYSEKYSTVLVADVTNFFGSIPPDLVMSLVKQRAGTSKVVDAIESILDRFNLIANRGGLPQRSLASSFLANAFLSPVDDLLRRYADGHGAAVLRWMDDLWVFGGSVEQLRRLQLDVQDELRSIRLEINLGKTTIREGDDVTRLVADHDLEREPPVHNVAGSGAQYVSHHDPADLDRVFEQFIDRPELADRTTIRYMCARIRAFERRDLLPAVIDAVASAPQGADHFSRLLRWSGAWRDLDGWYVEMARSPTGVDRLPWPIAQLGTMFPGSDGSVPVADLFAGCLENHQMMSVDLTALTAHRLAKWSPDDARLLLRRVAADSERPMCRRIAAIALHNLGGDAAKVAQALSEFEDNRGTLAFLQATGSRKVSENADFDPIAV